MKCISLWQPWASLMSIGAKKIETRSWTTSYRGWLAIHASKKWTGEQKLLSARGEFHKALDGHFPTIQERCFDFGAYRDGTNFVLPIGQIVAVAKLVDCLSTCEQHCSNVFGQYDNLDTLQERAFGDYSDGRFGWVAEALFRLPEPIPFKARQGLFDLPPKIVEQIRKQWRDHA